MFDFIISNYFFFHYEEINYMNLYDLNCLVIIPIVSYNDNETLSNK